MTQMMQEKIYPINYFSQTPYCTRENEIDEQVKVCNAHDWSSCLQHFTWVGNLYAKILGVQQYLLDSAYNCAPQLLDLTNIDQLKAQSMSCTDKLLCHLFTPKEEIHCNPCEELAKSVAALEECFEKDMCTFIEIQDSPVKQVKCYGPCGYFTHQESCFPAADNSTKADCSAILAVKECGVYDDATELSGDIED